MPTLNQLRGLRASDRTEEEQKAINQQMGYKEEPDTLGAFPIGPTRASMPVEEKPEADTTSALMINQALRYKQHLDDQYQQALAEKKQAYGTDRESISTNANDYLDSIANEVSSYYKKFKDTDKLPLDDQEKKQLAASYDARKKVYGEDNANIWLDNYMKDKVGSNQSWFEQATNAVSHLVPAIEGGLIQTYGMLHGALAHIAGADGYGENPDLNWWDSFMNDVIDNPVTRYGRDIEMSGASHLSDALNLIGLSPQTANERIAEMKATATKYNPEGIGEDAIVTTNEQDETYFNATTPWQALQSGGFTALSMLTGAAEAKAAGWLFGNLTKGATWLNKTGRIIKTEKGLERTLEGLKKAQNFADIAIIPGAVGSVEGAMEGLNTKIEVERDAVQKLDEYYKDKVSQEAEELFNNAPLVDVGDGTYRKMISPDEAFKQVWDKYQNEYTDARRQIDWASSKAGIHNFYANSLINGLANTTLKAGLMAPRVQETLRNSKLFGWAYKNPRFNVNTETGEVTSRLSKLGAVKQVLKEPIGEGAEEYLQSLSNDIFSGAAENNIDEFIKNKFEGDGTVKVTDSFGSDYAAALTALEGSLTNKESIESAILGAVSSSMGTIGGIGRGYHRDENGNLVRNSLLDPRNFTRGLDSEGNQESWTDFARRVTPWRSGLINAYFDRRQEQKDADETAANMTEWMKDPQNKAKWDGLVGTANWMTQMENAAESNDQFSYRKAQMGKAINDVFMLSKLKGTDYYDSMMTDLQRAANGEVTQEDIQKLKQQGGEEYQGNEEAIVEKIQSNANKMLGLMTQVETESRNLDRLLGRVDEDTKQSLIFGKIMEADFQERKDQLKQEIDAISQRINSSRSRSNVSLEDDLKTLILQYGTLNKALKAEEQLQAQKEKTQQKVDELEAIDPSKTSDKQKKELIKSKVELKKINRQLENLKSLRDENGQVDSSLAQLVLNEEEIMNLDPVTRAMVLAQGANKLYNATHQNRQRVNQLNLEIDEINHQIDALEAQKSGWMTEDGRVRKHHNKQVARNNQKIAELQKEKDKKIRALDAEQGRMDSKPVYNSAQQEVIDNLVQQGIAQDRDFLDKVVDMGRLEKGIKDYHTQYQAILSDPKAFQNYVQRAKYNAQRDLTKRRAERIAGIQNYQDYASELDRLTANASQQEMNEIMAVLRQENDKQKKQYQDNNMVVDEQTGELIASSNQPETNFDRYMSNIKKQGDLVRQFAKNSNLTDNDQSLLLDAMQYLSNQGIDVNDRDAAVQALIEKDNEGNIGGKFRQWVEAKNDMMPVQQRAFMPQFTSIGQIVGQYVDLLNGATEDAINRGNATPTITPATPQPGQPVQPTVVPNPAPNSPSPETTAATQQQATPAQPQGPSLFQMGYTTPEGGQLVDNSGTVATGTQTQSMQQRQQQSQQDEQKSVLRQMFEQVTTPEIAKMLDDASNIIETSNIPAEAKGIARQYLMDLAVNNNERFDTLDDLMTAIQEQANRLKTMSEQQEKQENPYSQAAGILQKVYGSLEVKKRKGRGRTLPMPSSRLDDPRAAWIHTANIAYMEKQNPDAWAVQFTNDHAIDEWNREHIISTNTPVYFITDSDWTAEVTRQMTNGDATRPYDTLTDMPVVAAVRVNEPQNPASTTAIEVDGLWYQPIGVMPSSKSKSQGAERTLDIRKNASKEQGRHLVMENTTPTARPLATRVYGANYLTAHHPDAAGETNRQNTAENNTDVIEDVLKTLPRESEDRLRAMSREDMLNDPEYMQARAKFLTGLVWGGNPQFPNNLAFIPDNRRQGEQGNPMLVFTKDMASTTGRTSGRPLTEVLANGSGEEVVNFNSRTKRLYNEILRPIYQYLIQDKNNDRSAKLITQNDLTANPNAFQEEAERLTKLLNGYDGSEQSKGIRGISDFIFVKPNSGWSIRVTAPEALQVVGDLNTSQSIYKVFFVNTDSSLQPIEIGTIRANQRDTDAAMELLRNIMYDAQTGQVRDFLNWQIPEADAQNLNNPDSSKSAKPLQNYADIVDDGLLEVAGSSLVYDVDGVKLQAPISTDGRIIYPQDQISNPVNATPAAPQNITPQGDGAIVTGNGQNVDPNSGANLGQGNPPTPPVRNKKLEDAKKITERIIADSKEFTLSEDETYYYITNKTTGEQEKYLRVTTVIGADESVQQWEPSQKDVLNKLKERHSISDAAYQTQYRDTQDMSDKLGIPKAEIKRAIAELRTAHKHEGYGPWSTPSTSIGNTFDSITRDFLAGHLKSNYPNVSKEVLDTFVHQLELFKADCDAQGIHLVSEGVMAHGTITMTDNEGNTHEVKVAGTLDLFGYDDAGNFYIFDMKTTRKHSEQKLQDERAKWSRQISMYADLLKQSYPGFDIKADRLRIIPINVSYPTPMGKRADYLDPSGPEYSETDDGQLQMQYRRQSEPQNFTMAMPQNPKESNGDNAVGMRKTGWKDQFKPGYTPFNINWDNLSSEDQDIADALTTQTNDSQHSAEQAPQGAQIETPAPRRPSFIAKDAFIDDYSTGTQAAAPSAPPVVPNGQKPVLPSWKNATPAQKQAIEEAYGIDNAEDYNELLNDPTTAEGIAQDLKCRGLL